MSAATATLIAGGLAILGTLLGVVIERLMRLVGRLKCVDSGWAPEVLHRVSDGEGGTVYAEPERAEDAGWANYRLSIDLFNGRETPTGLRDVRMELVTSEGSRSTSRPQDLSTAQKSEMFGVRHDDLTVINLSPRQFVRKELRGRFDKEAAVALASGKWSRVEFVGELPTRPFLGLLGSKTFRHVIAERR